MRKFTLHTHSACSDGSDTPEQLVKKAVDEGLALCALTDHDTTAGVKAAQLAARGTGLYLLPGIEYDTQYDEELHILGLGIDVDDPLVKEAWEKAELRRADRNRRMVEKLHAAGHDIERFMNFENCTVTRLHIARALVAAGSAQSIPDAFSRFLVKGQAGYVSSVRPTQEETIELIHKAGGIAVLAHPCKLHAEPHATVRKLAEMGLDGLEAWYPTSTPGQTALFLSLCAQYGLMPTCGSDYHGSMRDGTLASAWVQDARLESLLDFLIERFFS